MNYIFITLIIICVIGIFYNFIRFAHLADTEYLEFRKEMDEFFERKYESLNKVTYENEV
jgi:hypothetical protein